MPGPWCIALKAENTEYWTELLAEELAKRDVVLKKEEQSALWNAILDASGYRRGVLTYWIEEPESLWEQMGDAGRRLFRDIL